jgi:hypothetical protein
MKLLYGFLFTQHSTSSHQPSHKPCLKRKVKILPIFVTLSNKEKRTFQVGFLYPYVSLKQNKSRLQEKGYRTYFYFPNENTCKNHMHKVTIHG